MTADAATHRKRPVHLWTVGILSLLWNCVGAFDYLASQLRLEFYMSQFSKEQMAYFEAFPSWAIATWAFGVWGAFAGSIGLLLGRGWAVWAFAVSLAGLAANTVYSFGLSAGLDIMGTEGIVMSAVVWLVAIALLWYAVRQRNNGVLR